MGIVADRKAFFENLSKDPPPPKVEAKSLSDAGNNASTLGGQPVGSTTSPCPQDKFKLINLILTVNAPNDKFVMNDPNRTFEVCATVNYEKSSDPNDLAALPTEVKFTFTDQPSPNTNNTDSFEYISGKYLGKNNDTAAVFWEGHSGNISTVPVTNDATNKKMTGKVNFKPSGVGGDGYKIKAAVQNGAGELTDESHTIVVWRKIKLEAYEMPMQNHVSTYGTKAIMEASFYTPDTFVEYELGAIHNIANTHKVKYIGLWSHSANSQLNWATHPQKLPSETPTASEIADANGPSGAAQTAAKAAIQAKANAWRDRIITAYTSGLDNWATDAGVPVNSLVAIEFEHPKYSAHAPDADSITNEWGGSDFSWLTIDVEGETPHPDDRWIGGVGLSRANCAYITAGDSAAATKNTIAHEAGHETKNQFKRKRFGSGDHSASAGLMDPFGSLDAFTNDEKKILRGLT